MDSLPPHNDRELTREMLVVILNYFSTLLPSKFNDRLVRLVVHGGACMLLHPDLDKLAANTPPFLLSPGWSPGPLPQQSERSDSPIPDVKRTQTRDVDIIARSFDVEWRQVGIHDSVDRLKDCIAATARKFGLGLDWMNADADVALPMALDPITNIIYDPIHRDAVQPNNIARHTIYKSSNGMLQLVSVTPFWAVALKLVRYTKSDPGDICLILRNGTNLSGTRWTSELVEKWLVDNCWPMGYASYDHRRLAQLRSRIDHVVAMVKAYDDIPDEDDQQDKRPKGKSKTRLAAAPAPAPAPALVPPTTPYFQPQPPPPPPPPPPQPYPYAYTYPYTSPYPYMHYTQAYPPMALPAIEVTPPSINSGQPIASTSSYVPTTLAEWMPNPPVSRRNTEQVISTASGRPAMPRADTWAGPSTVADDKEDKRRKRVMEWLDANSRREAEESSYANYNTYPLPPPLPSAYVPAYPWPPPSIGPPSLPLHPLYGGPPPPPPAAPSSSSQTSSFVPPPPILSPTPIISVKSPSPVPPLPLHQQQSLSYPPLPLEATPAPRQPPPRQYPSPAPRTPPTQTPPPRRHQQQARDDTPPVIPSPSLLSSPIPRNEMEHHARYGPYGRDGPLGVRRDRNENEESSEEEGERQGEGEGEGEEIESDEDWEEARGAAERSPVARALGSSPAAPNDAHPVQGGGTAGVAAWNPFAGTTMPSPPSAGTSSEGITTVPLPGASGWVGVQSQRASTSQGNANANANAHTNTNTNTNVNVSGGGSRGRTGRGGIRDLTELVSGMHTRELSSSSTTSMTPASPASPPFVPPLPSSYAPSSHLPASVPPTSAYAPTTTSITSASPASPPFVPPLPSAYAPPSHPPASVPPTSAYAPPHVPSAPAPPAPAPAPARTSVANSQPYLNWISNPGVPGSRTMRAMTPHEEAFVPPFYSNSNSPSPGLFNSAAARSSHSSSYPQRSNTHSDPRRSNPHSASYNRNRNRDERESNLNSDSNSNGASSDDSNDDDDDDDDDDNMDQNTLLSFPSSTTAVGAPYAPPVPPTPYAGPIHPPQVPPPPHAMYSYSPYPYSYPYTPFGTQPHLYPLPPPPPPQAAGVPLSASTPWTLSAWANC